MENQDSKIHVIVRKRPMNRKEQQNNDRDILYQKDEMTIVVREERVKVDLTKYTEEHDFIFDRVFGDNASNQIIYQQVLQPLVEAAFQGTKVSCFAYGQTGSGKTFTMMGQNGQEGLYALAANDMYYIRDNYFPQYELFVSFYEIYCSRLYDLLNNKNLLHARTDARQNVNIVGLQRKKANSVQELMQIMQFGLNERTTGQTGANDQSSRSHAILEIAIKENQKFRGKMNFIDLAGSERGADVGDSNRQTRQDSSEINKSLLALKECIRALDQEQKHTPFRGSKLTQVLKDSFIGKCKTIMIANVSPCFSSCEHTLNTLRYSDRVKELGRGKRNTNNVMMLPRQRQNITRIQPTEPIQTMSMDELSKQHENIIGVILEEEEDLISQHRKVIDELVDTIKQQMNILSDVDKPGSDVDQYIQRLEQVLDFKSNIIENLQERVRVFKDHLKQEEEMSRRFYENNQDDDLEVFDLDENDHNNLLSDFN